MISAEILPKSDARLQELVLEHMIHSSRKDVSTPAPCMGARACIQGLPKPFHADTGHSINDYYIVSSRKSSQDGEVSMEKEVRVGRGIQMFSLEQHVGCSSHSHCTAHVRTVVEVCVSRICGIKYLFKYVCKRSDRVTIKIISDGKRNNETDHFQNARYLSASESVWRSMAFDLADRSLLVARFDLHLEGIKRWCLWRDKNSRRSLAVAAAQVL